MDCRLDRFVISTVLRDLHVGVMLLEGITVQTFQGVGVQIFPDLVGPPLSAGQAWFWGKNQIKNCLNYAEEATRMVLELTGFQDET